MRLMLCLVLVLSTGCVSTRSRSFSYLDQPLAPLPDSVAVNVWPAGVRIEHPYHIVGEVYVERAASLYLGQVDRAALVDELRAEGRRLGADGIVSMLSGNRGVGSRPGVDQAWFWGVAIQYVDQWQDDAGQIDRRRLDMEERARERFAGRISTE